MSLVIVSSCTVAPFARPAGADISTTISSEKAKASQLQQQIQSTGQQIDALDQQYDAAVAKKQSIDQQITTTKGKISQTQSTISTDRTSLKTAAVRAYVSNGAAATQDPLFSGNQSSTMDARVYDNVAEGDLGTAVANLNTAENQLNAQEAVLNTQDNQAAQAVSSSENAENQAKSLEAQQQQALTQANGQIAQLITEQQKQEEAQAAQAAAAKLAQEAQAAQEAQTAAAQATREQATAGSSSVATVADPPPASNLTAGERAVAAAQTQLGVPYQWGAESPGSGFDCSGLTAWAWGQAGVPLPHYSGAQDADSTPVPLSDLEPGDLLFYGPGGDTHVAMYVGGGEMIQAPYTGADVSYAALTTRPGWFAGAGRP